MWYIFPQTAGLSIPKKSKSTGTTCVEQIPDVLRYRLIWPLLIGSESPVMSFVFAFYVFDPGTHTRLRCVLYWTQSIHLNLEILGEKGNIFFTILKIIIETGRSRWGQHRSTSSFQWWPSHKEILNNNVWTCSSVVFFCHVWLQTNVVHHFLTNKKQTKITSSMLNFYYICQHIKQ